MGVEYRHFIVPWARSFCPTSSQLARFVRLLEEENWIAVPGTEKFRKMNELEGRNPEQEHFGSRQLPPRLKIQRIKFEPLPYPLLEEWFEDRRTEDLKLSISVSKAGAIGLRGPFLGEDEPWEECYHDFDLHLGRTFICQTSDSIEPGHKFNLVCRCGAELAYYDPDMDIFYAQRIHPDCPECARPFDPHSLEFVIRDGWTNESSTITGGATYRFAVVVDCGKCLPPRDNGPIKVSLDLMALCRLVFETDFYEVGEIY